MQAITQICVWKVYAFSLNTAGHDFVVVAKNVIDATNKAKQMLLQHNKDAEITKVELLHHAII